MSIATTPEVNQLFDAELERLICKVVRTTVEQLDAATTAPPFIRSRECAHLIGASPEHLCAMRARGEGPPWSGEGKWIRYERSAVLAWIRTLPRHSETSSDIGQPAPSADPNMDSA